MAYHQIVEKQRAYFKAGNTRCLSKRREALLTFKKLLEEHGEEIANAIYKDLHRDAQFEIVMTMGAVNECLEKLEEWNAPTKLPATGPALNDKDSLSVPQPQGQPFPLGNTSTVGVGSTATLAPSVGLT